MESTTWRQRTKLFFVLLLTGLFLISTSFKLKVHLGFVSSHWMCILLCSDVICLTFITTSNVLVTRTTSFLWKLPLSSPAALKSLIVWNVSATSLRCFASSKSCLTAVLYFHHFGCALKYIFRLSPQVLCRGSSVKSWVT